MVVNIYLNVSSIMVKSTNFPSNGTTNDVGGIISASSKKNTVNESRIDMLNDTCVHEKRNMKGYNILGVYKSSSLSLSFEIDL